jgi:hypothetical protein
VLRFRIPALAAMLFAVCAAFSASAAYATAPTREPAPIPPSFTVEGICSFTVQVDVLVNREKITTFSNGTQLITGTVKDRLTNASDPEQSIVVNASGPATLVPQSDGTLILTGRGLGLQPFPAGASITGMPEFLQFSGREVLRFNPDGSFKEITRAHVKLDVCAALA